MSLDRELRDMLAERADQFQAPVPDVDALRAGGLVRQRRHRQVVGAVTGLALVGTLAASLVVGIALRNQAAPEPADHLPSDVVGSTGVPWCFPDPDHPGEELVVGAGPPVQTVCSGRDVWLAHQAGSTIVAPHFVFRVADGHLTQLGSEPNESRVVKMSHDGRLVAWLSSVSELLDGQHVCRLNVYEVATAAEVGATALPLPPGAFCAGPEGIDDLGRVYVTIIGRGSHDHEVQMYDTRTGESTQVLGLPTSTAAIDEDGTFISYVTAEGFAVLTDEHVSVEGVVDADSRFVQQREVPVGSGLWSPDRSLFLEQRVNGVFVRPASDLTTGHLLDLPRMAGPLGGFRRQQWESPTSVLVSGGQEPNPNYRCDVRSAVCQRLSTDAQLAYGNSRGYGLGVGFGG